MSTVFIFEIKSTKKDNVPNTTLKVLSEMVLMNFVAFVVFKILYNLVSMQNVLTAGISKILKTVQRDLTFIFDVLLGSAISFVSSLVL